MRAENLYFMQSGDKVSTHHEVTIEPIGEVAIFMKNLIPADIPETYAIKPMLESVASEQDIRNGVFAFREFLYLFFDRLTSDGTFYAKPPKRPSSMTDYPFLHNIANLLVEIGYRSTLAENGASLLVTEISPHIASKISGSNIILCLRFLTLCGFVFNGIDLDARMVDISQVLPLEVSYPQNPITLTGLKALAIADMELRTTKRYWNDNYLFRCDYRAIKTDGSDIIEILKDYLHPLPENVREFALNLHRRYTDMGMTCSIRILGDVNFAYADISKSRRKLSATDIYALSVWQISISMKNGYCIFVRPKKADKYAEAIEKFPLTLRERIISGYGCDRKRGERCQGGCQGIPVSLDDSIIDIAKDIEIWLDSETQNLLRK